MSKLDALIETAKLRFRPIAITVLTTIIGMLPIAISVGQGGEILQPLGVAVTGGLGGGFYCFNSDCCSCMS